MNETLCHDETRVASPAPAASEKELPLDDLAGLETSHRSAKQKWLITASYALSLAIFAWSVTLSIRSTAETPPAAPAAAAHAVPPVADSPPSSTKRSGTSRQAKSNQSDGEAFRAEAIALDRQFMQRQKQQRRSSGPLPAHQEAAARWQMQVDRLRRQLRDHPQPKKHSVLWGQKKQLEALLADPPIPPSSAR